LLVSGCGVQVLFSGCHNSLAKILTKIRGANFFGNKVSATVYSVEAELLGNADYQMKASE
jgi:hypothetical protein